MEALRRAQIVARAEPDVEPLAAGKKQLALHSVLLIGEVEDERGEPLGPLEGVRKVIGGVPPQPQRVPVGAAKDVLGAAVAVKALTEHVVQIERLAARLELLVGEVELEQRSLGL